MPTKVIEVNGKSIEVVDSLGNNNDCGLWSLLLSTASGQLPPETLEIMGFTEIYNTAKHLTGENQKQYVQLEIAKLYNNPQLADQQFAALKTALQITLTSFFENKIKQATEAHNDKEAQFYKDYLKYTQETTLKNVSRTFVTEYAEEQSLYQILQYAFWHKKNIYSDRYEQNFKYNFEFYNNLFSQVIQPLTYNMEGREITTDKRISLHGLFAFKEFEKEDIKTYLNIQPEKKQYWIEKNVYCHNNTIFIVAKTSYLYSANAPEESVSTAFNIEGNFINKKNVIDQIKQLNAKHDNNSVQNEIEQIITNSNHTYNKKLTGQDRQSISQSLLKNKGDCLAVSKVDRFDQARLIQTGNDQHLLQQSIADYADKSYAEVSDLNINTYIVNAYNTNHYDSKTLMLSTGYKQTNGNEFDAIHEQCLVLYNNEGRGHFNSINATEKNLTDFCDAIKKLKRPETKEIDNKIKSFKKQSEENKQNSQRKAKEQSAAPKQQDAKTIDVIVNGGNQNNKSQIVKQNNDKFAALQIINNAAASNLQVNPLDNSAQNGSDIVNKTLSQNNQENNQFNSKDDAQAKIDQNTEYWYNKGQIIGNKKTIQQATPNNQIQKNPAVAQTKQQMATVALSQKVTNDISKIFRESIRNIFDIILRPEVSSVKYSLNSSNNNYQQGQTHANLQGQNYTDLQGQTCPNTTPLQSLMLGELQNNANSKIASSIPEKSTPEKYNELEKEILYNIMCGTDYELLLKHSNKQLFDDIIAFNEKAECKIKDLPEKFIEENPKYKDKLTTIDKLFAKNPKYKDKLTTIDKLFANLQKVDKICVSLLTIS